MSYGTSKVEVHVGAPDGPLFASTGARYFLHTTGDWVAQRHCILFVKRLWRFVVGCGEHNRHRHRSGGVTLFWIKAPHVIS